MIEQRTRGKGGPAVTCPGYGASDDTQAGWSRQIPLSCRMHRRLLRYGQAPIKALATPNH